MQTVARIVGAFLALTVLFSSPAPAALAQGAPFCAPGSAPTFVQGFAQLKAVLGDTMGSPVECEHTNGSNGDVLQQTTTGLAFWRKSTNTPSFTDGNRHWALTANGLLTWLGESVYPPATARPASGQNIAGGGRTESAAVSAIGAGQRRTPNEFVYRTIDQAPPTSGWPCQSRNPSCGREDWWAQWNELQDRSWLQFKFIGPGLVTEARFVEAIALLWIWPEGRELLETAAKHGVVIHSSQEIARRAFAAYRPADRTLMVNPNFTEVSTWLLADIVAHELRHASDHATGTRMGAGYADCVAREQAAFNTERDFVRWLAERQGGLPSSDQVSKLLSQEDFALFSDVYRTLNTPNLNAQVEESYRSICRGGR